MKEHSLGANGSTEGIMSKDMYHWESKFQFFSCGSFPLRHALMLSIAGCKYLPLV